MNTLTINGFRPAPQARQSHAETKPGLMGLLAREWVYFRARRALAQLGDEGLHDIGMGRSEIGAAVRHGRPTARR